MLLTDFKIQLRKKICRIKTNETNEAVIRVLEIRNATHPKIGEDMPPL